MQIHLRKWAKICMTLFAMTLPLFMASCGGKTEPTFNIAGTWSLFRITDATVDADGKVTTPAAEERNIFSFTTSDNDVTGINTSTTPNEPVTGSVSSRDVNFSTSATDGSKKNYSGQLSSDGSTMSGTWVSTDANGQPTSSSGTWSALVEASPTFNISGLEGWSLTEPAAGFGAVQGFIFRQSVNDLTVSGSESTTTPEINIVTGSVGGLNVTFFWTSAGVTYTLNGTINGGNTMSGTWKDTNVPSNSGIWTAIKN